jgi:hypothetical protein
MTSENIRPEETVETTVEATTEPTKLAENAGPREGERSSHDRRGGGK